MGFINQQRAAVNNNDPKLLANKYQSARINLIFIAALTAINIVMLATGGDSYFLFSANIPYLLVFFGMMNTGMLPDEFYEGGKDTYQFLDPAVFTVLLVISLVIVALYVVFFVLSSKRRVAWLIAAEVFFVLDTLAMFAFYGFDLSMIIDIAFHIYVVVSFAMGISAEYKLRALPPEAFATEPTVPVGYGTEDVEAFDAPVVDTVDSDTDTEAEAEADTTDTDAQ